MTRLNMKQQLVLLFLCMMVPVYTLHLYGSWKAEDILKSNVTNAYKELNKQNFSLITRDIELINKITRTILQNPIMQRIGKPEQYSVYERIQHFEELDDLLASYSTEVSGAGAVDYSFYAYDPDDYYSFAPSTQLTNRGVYFLNDDELPDWYDEALAKKGTGYLKVFEEYGAATKQPTLAYIRAVNSTERAGRPIGVLVATSVERIIKDSLNTVSLPDGEIYLTDWDGQVYISNEGIFGQMIDVPPDPTSDVTTSYQGVYSLIDEDMIHVVHYNSYIQQKLVYKIPVEALLSQQSELKLVIQTITIGSTILVIIILFYFWRSLMNPLHKLVGFVRLYEPGGKLPKVQTGKRNDEIGVLMSSVYDMALRMNALFRDRYEMEIKQREAQLKILYEQINPHLLYNTLESIYWKVSLEGSAESAQMIKELSKLMKIALSRGKELISLKDELEHAKAYIQLQKMRYDYTFQVEWQIDELDEDMMNVLIPKISLQPLLENAIIHGVKSMGDEGMIIITVKDHESGVSIQVADNGYKEVDLDKLHRLIRDDEPSTDLGYGVRNVQQRMRLHYGEGYGLSYQLAVGGGLVAELVLPLQRPELPTI